MTTRRITIDADPAACADGLAVLAALRRAGRDGLDGSIAALTAIVAKGEAKPKHRDWRVVPTHLATDYADPEPAGSWIETLCGVDYLGVDSMDSRSADRSYECATAVGNIVNVTDGPELTTCQRCLRAKAAQEKRGARKKPQTSDVG